MRISRNFSSSGPDPPEVGPWGSGPAGGIGPKRRPNRLQCRCNVANRAFSGPIFRYNVPHFRGSRGGSRQTGVQTGLGAKPGVRLDPPDRAIPGNRVWPGSPENGKSADFPAMSGTRDPGNPLSGTRFSCNVTLWELPREKCPRLSLGTPFLTPPGHCGKRGQKRAVFGIPKFGQAGVWVPLRPVWPAGRSGYPGRPAG